MGFGGLVRRVRDGKNAFPSVLLPPALWPAAVAEAPPCCRRSPTAPSANPEEVFDDTAE